MRRRTEKTLNRHLRVLSAAVAVVLFCSLHVSADSQVIVRDKYLRIQAQADDPLFTTYAAAKDRSRLYADKAYFMNYFTPDRPIIYSSQDAGDWSTIWRIGNVVVDKISQFQEPPVVVASFPDMAVLEYEPFAGVKVQEVFCVYSNLYSGYPDRFRDMLVSDTSPQSYGAYPFCKLSDFEPVLRRFNEYDAHKTKLDQVSAGRSGLIALQIDLSLAPGESADVRFVRGCQAAGSERSEMERGIKVALSANMQSLVDADVSLYSSIPRISFKTSPEKLVYLGAFNLVRQCMLPPSGAARHNYYVFSRNPIWGWGHGHQVMHESLSMIPFAYLDWKSAEESQRIYMDQQSPDGLIPYRVGPRGPQSYPRDSIGTTSAPFFSWTNWEIYKISRDRSFLSEAYKSGSKFEGASLRRKEIIGFLPMWAHVATKEQAAELVKELKNPKTFWRKYGVPTVAADDPGYTPFVDDCCHWNGPIWMLWDYMVMDGLEHYGYKRIADEVADKMLLAAETQLRKSHGFWESYSADFPIQQSPPNYIWDSILAKVLIEKYSAK